MSVDRDVAVADLAVARQRKRKEQAVAEDATHHDMALAWLASRTVDKHAPAYASGSIYLPGDDGLWRPMSHEALQVEIARQFNGRKLCRKNADYRSIADHVTALCDSDGFFDDAPPGVVSPLGFHRLNASGVVETVALSLAHLQTFALSWAPDFEGEAPRLDAVLRQAFDGDHADEQAELWWQCVGAAMFGLMPRLQLVLLLLGRERSGKSLLQRVLERAFPATTVGAVSPASWGHEYHVAALAGKRLNVVGELDDGRPIPAAAFKNVTGQNLVAGRHPTHRPFSFRCQAAHVFASNVLPPTTDRSDAFYRRWRVLRFANTVPPDKVDPDLCDRIVADEMPAFLAAAFRGAETVAQLGRVETTPAHDAVIERWRLAANPLQQFLADPEWVELDPEAKAHGTGEVYEVYRRWSSSAGFRNPFGRNHFLELLEATGATRGVRIKRHESRNMVAGVRLLRTE